MYLRVEAHGGACGRQVGSAPGFVSDLSYYFNPGGILVLISLVRGLSVMGTNRIVLNISHIGRENYCLNIGLDCLQHVMNQWLSGKSHACRVSVCVGSFLQV